MGPPPGDTDLRPDLEVTSPESLAWGPTPLELLTKKGGPGPPQGWETLVPSGTGPTLVPKGLCARLTSR